VKELNDLIAEIEGNLSRAFRNANEPDDPSRPLQQVAKQINGSYVYHVTPILDRLREMADSTRGQVTASEVMEVSGNNPAVIAALKAAALGNGDYTEATRLRDRLAEIEKEQEVSDG